MTSFAESNPVAWARGRAQAAAELSAALPTMRATIADLEQMVASNDPALYAVDQGRTYSKATDLNTLRHGVAAIEAAIERDGAA